MEVFDSWVETVAGVGPGQLTRLRKQIKYNYKYKFKYKDTDKDRGISLAERGKQIPSVVTF